MYTKSYEKFIPISTFFASTPLFADIEKDIDKIEVPTEELETESVLPVFDKSEVIKVKTSIRLSELNLVLLQE